MVPGSHRALTTPQQFESVGTGEGEGAGDKSERSESSESTGFVPVAVAAEAPAGSALIFDGRLLHGTGQVTAKYIDSSDDRLPRCLLLAARHAV